MAAFQPLEVTYRSACKQASQVCRGSIALDHDVASAIAKKSCLGHINFGSLRGAEEDVVMCCVGALDEQVRGDAASEMVAPTRRDMQSAEDFFVLNVFAARGQFLRSEPEFTQFADHGICEKARIMIVDNRLVPGNETGGANGAVGHGQHPEGAVTVSHREFALGIGRDEVDLARWQICDIGAASAEAMALLRFLLAELQTKGC